MRLRSPRTLAAGAVALVLLAGGATALAKSGSSPSDPSTKAPSVERGLFTTILGRELAATSMARMVGVKPAFADCALPVPLRDPFKAAADYLSLSVDQLKNELRGGASLAEIATKHGKSVDGLEQALIDAAKSDLDQSVAAGDITADQKQQMLSELRSHIDDFVNRKGGVPFPPAKPPLGDPLAAAANYLGLSVDHLGQELQAGESLADVAKAHGKSVDGLEQALIDAAKADLGQSVAAGDITADQEHQLLSRLSSQIDDFVNGNGDLSIRIENKGLSIQIGRPASGVMLNGPYRTAADYLGLPVDQLTKELQAGKSLADIATEHGKSVDGLKQALVAAETAEIEKSVDELVNQKGLAGPPCGDGVVGTAELVAPALGFGLLRAP
jgi:lambda repressor-like predicted transcriptional regulator